MYDIEVELRTFSVSDGLIKSSFHIHINLLIFLAAIFATILKLFPFALVQSFY